MISITHSVGIGIRRKVSQIGYANSKRELLDVLGSESTATHG